jgi:predicted alpha/beta-fold hydrolase
MDQFNPPFYLKNPHIQSIIASTGPRRLILHRRAKKLIDDSKQYTLDCENGIRLQGDYAFRQNNKRGLVIFIHGWLGSSDSLYLLSAGNNLYKNGYNIFRLNLRDHGNSESLNKKIFNSTRINEVIQAIKKIQQLFPHNKNFLAGFSLGGNFSLRVAEKATENKISLNQVAAICPVINPYNTNRNLHLGIPIYHNHFRDTWKKSLLNKLNHFPEYGYKNLLNKLSTIDEMNEYFVNKHTSFNDVNSYLSGYAIDGSYLEDVDIPCHIISSQDDPIICCKDLTLLADNKSITIELTRYGGHCGYINSLLLTSWIDQRMLKLFNTHST